LILDVHALTGYHRNVTRSVSRRQWIASAVAALCARRLHAATHITKGRVSAITDELGFSQPDAVAAAKEFSLQWVDLRNVPGTPREVATLAEPELRRYASELAGNKLKVSVLHVGARNDIAQAVNAAAIVGAGGVRVRTGQREADPAKALPAVAAGLGEFVAMAEAAKIRLLIPNQSTQNVCTSAEAKAILELLPSKWVGLDWIPGEALKLGETPWLDGYRELPKGRVFHVTAEAADFGNGPGSLNWRAILEALQRDGFPGEIGLETGSGGGAFQKEDEPMRDLLHVVGEL
jgi:sugar phosphate isomerase/epimerase